VIVAVIMIRDTPDPALTTPTSGGMRGTQVTGAFVS
jgi:hypothetical protein